MRCRPRRRTREVKLIVRAAVRALRLATLSQLPPRPSVMQSASLTSRRIRFHQLNFRPANRAPAVVNIPPQNGRDIERNFFAVDQWRMIRARVADSGDRAEHDKADGNRNRLRNDVTEQAALPNE